MGQQRQRVLNRDNSRDPTKHSGARRGAAVQAYKIGKSPLYAEAVFARLRDHATATLWTNQLFLPGQYPLEALEQQLRRNSFAVLVASPDDTVIKRNVQSPAMRDNLLLEFGLFAGALGRRHVFFVCPDQPRVDLPSDLFGVIRGLSSNWTENRGKPERYGEWGTDFWRL
jgi:predicted nucleotide-binding protein